MRNKEIIEDTIREVYTMTLLNKEEAKILSDYVNFLNAINVNSFFVPESISAIQEKIHKSTESQEAIMDIVNILNVKLAINGLDNNKIIEIIKKSVTDFSTSPDVLDDLKKQLKPNTEVISGVIMSMSYIIRLYGIAILLEFSDLIPKGDTGVQDK